jgi:O-antigen ligase
VTTDRSISRPIVADAQPRRGPRILVIGVPLLICYAVVIGGAPAGELFGPVRAFSAVLAGAVIWAYLRSMPSRHDRIDRAMAIALLCVAAASLVSAFPRQSLDAVLGCLIYVVGFGLARQVLRNAAIRSVTRQTMMLLSVAVTGLLAFRLAGVTLEFLELTRWSVFPPLGLRIDASPWGHPYDVALLAVMLYPSWFFGRPGRTRVGAAVVVGCVLLATVVLMGSRAVWVASLGGMFLWVLPHIGLRWRALGGRWVAAGIGLVAVLVSAALIAAPSFIDRIMDAATLGQRGQMWVAGMQAWAMRPIAGFGPGSFPWILQETDYFDSNTLAPRHPDSAIFQLLPEAGLLGLVAVGVVLAVLSPRIWRNRSSGARFALGGFAVASLASNPTDFPYLVVVALIWAALASPRVLDRSPIIRRPARLVRAASYGGVAIIALAVVSTSVAGMSYDLANRFVDSGQTARARQSFNLAVTLDPGMALYWRQRGTLELLTGDPESATPDLRIATRINPSDDLAWRTLALAHHRAGRNEEADAALQQAVSAQRSDPTNLLMSAAWTASSSPSDEVLAELLQSWPTLPSAPAWDAVAPGSTVTSQAAELALRRWDSGTVSLEPRSTQGDWLAVIAAPDRIVGEGSATDAADPGHVRLRLAVCGLRSEAAVRSLPLSDQRFSEYWALVVQLAAESGGFDERAARMYSIIAAQNLHADGWKLTLNPLHENDTRGYSADQWGYRRLAIQWPDYQLELPSPMSGSLRWMLDPVGAREQAQVTISDRC